MIVTNLSNSFNPVPKIITTKKEKAKGIKGKKHKRTKETDIDIKVKIKVWERDLHKCIFCGQVVSIHNANAHFIPRSAGGLGIEENIFTACDCCHHEQDNGLNTEKYDIKAEKYLKKIYGDTWNKEKLIYKKFKQLEETA